MDTFDSIGQVVQCVKSKLDGGTKKKIVALYAFNATGKTRLTTLLEEEIGTTGEEKDNSVKVLCYNAFLEDIFVWDNKSCVFTFHPSFWIFPLILEQGLEDQIVKIFRDIIRLPIEPSFDFEKGTVIFKIVSGNEDDNESNIKISRGEESMFVWSVFYTLLETTLDALSTSTEERTTRIFDKLQYILIDDPVSSMDDTKIIGMAVKLIQLIKKSQNNNVKIFITTHHALFFG